MAVINKWGICFTLFLAFIGCKNNEMKSGLKPVHLITLDPGHFHAALVQKTMYDDVDSTVHVYAPERNDLQLHLGRVNAYNNRVENPTRWNEVVYKGDDFFEKMIAEKKGNVVVLSGNNQKKSEYILRSLENGFNVFADKPMVIDSKGFEELKKAFDIAKEKKLLLYDIMTERFEITTMLQRELAMTPEVFGELEKGTIDNPAVAMESEHNFYKNVSGSVVVRPGWFMDGSQQGQGIVDVSTHLVDLVQWECFPEQDLDYTKDILIDSAVQWPTRMTNSQFKTITKLDSIPAYLDKDKQNDTTINVWSNGQFSYTIKGVHAKIYVEWKYQTASGVDTHYSIIRGTKAALEIRQGVNEEYKPVLYILPNKDIIESGKMDEYEKFLALRIKQLQIKYPGLELEKKFHEWKVIIPDKYKEGHEEHFAKVTNNFLEYLKNHNMPSWEVPNMLAKYYTTTKALELAKQR